MHLLEASCGLHDSWLARSSEYCKLPGDCLVADVRATCMPTDFFEAVRQPEREVHCPAEKAKADPWLFGP